MSALRIFFILSAVAGASLLAFALVNPHLYLAPDSFTYFRMARVFAENGLFYSYSGIDHATGIHPAYYLFLLPLAPVCSSLLPACALVLNAVLIVIALVLLARTFTPVVALGALWILLLSQAAGSVHNGMESSLAFLLLSLVAYLSSRITSRRGQGMLGIVLGLLVFSRLDLVFFALAFLGLYALAHLWKGNFFDTVRTVLWIGVPSALVIGAALMLNLAYDGTPLPLSGELKSSFPNLNPDWKASLGLLKPFPVALVALGAYLLLAPTRRMLLFGALFLSTLALFAYNLLFVSGIGAWYGILPIFTLALLGGFFLQDVMERFPARRIPLLLGIFALVIIVAFSGHRSRMVEDWIRPHERAAAFLKGREGAAAEYKDGVFAFYASMPVYSLTGLANNQAYVDALREGTLDTYLAEREVRLIIGGTASSGLQVPGAMERIECEEPIYDDGGVSVYDVASCRVESQ